MNDEKRARKPRADRRVRQRPHYSEAQKIAACTAAMQTGPAVSVEALQAVRLVLDADVSEPTVRRWLKDYRPLIEQTDQSLAVKSLDIPQLISSTRERVIQNLNSAANKIAARINTDEAINKAALRDLSVSLGISIDKILLLAGRNPELDSLATTLQQECLGTTFDPILLMEDIIAGVRRAKARAASTIDVTPTVND